MVSLQGEGRWRSVAPSPVSPLALTPVPKLLWAFDFEPVGEMDVNKFEPGHLTAPVEFKCNFKPRNAQVAETIVSEYEEARELLRQYEFE
jgi:hypothetical protein